MKKLLLLLTFILISSGSFAQGLDLDDADYSHQPIDISGNYTKKVAPKRKRVTPADRMKSLRERLEKQNELMVQKKIERIRYKAELEMMKKLQKAFDNQMKELDSQLEQI